MCCGGACSSVVDPSLGKEICSHLGWSTLKQGWAVDLNGLAHGSFFLHSEPSLQLLGPKAS